MHKRAADLVLEKELGAKEYGENIHQNTAIGKSITAGCPLLIFFHFFIF